MKLGRLFNIVTIFSLSLLSACAASRKRYDGNAFERILVTDLKSKVVFDSRQYLSGIADKYQATYDMRQAVYTYTPKFDITVDKAAITFEIETCAYIRQRAFVYNPVSDMHELGVVDMFSRTYTDKLVYSPADNYKLELVKGAE